MVQRTWLISGATRMLMATAFFLFACGESGVEKEPTKTEKEALFLDYRLTGDEETGIATLRLQYRQGGRDEEVLHDKETIRVWLDEEKLVADSSGQTGIFYETEKPIDSFAGKHTVRFSASGSQNKMHSFSFQPIKLAEELPEVFPKKPFSVILNRSVPHPSTILVLLTDTSFESADVNEELPVRNGQVMITAEHLKNLSAGPVNMELIQEEEQPLRTNGQRSGRILFTYTIRRNISLTP